MFDKKAGRKQVSRIVAFLAAGATLLAGMTLAPAANAGTLTGYSDTPDWAWYAGAVKWVSTHHVMTGYNNGKFGPDNHLTRAETAVLFWKKANSPQESDSKVDDELNNAFADGFMVTKWARQAFAWNVRNNVMTGEDVPCEDGEGNLTGTVKQADGDNPLTREMLATVLARDVKADISTADTSKMTALTNGNRVSDWARHSVAWAVNKGILRGWPDSRGLDPQGTVTRAEAATMIARAMGGNPGGALSAKPKPKPRPRPASRPRKPSINRHHIPTLAEEERMYPFPRFLRENSYEKYENRSMQKRDWIAYCQGLIDEQTPGTPQYNCLHNLGCIWA